VPPARRPGHRGDPRPGPGLAHLHGGTGAGAPPTRGLPRPTRDAGRTGPSPPTRLAWRASSARRSSVAPLEQARTKYGRALASSRPRLHGNGHPRPRFGLPLGCDGVLDAGHRTAIITWTVRKPQRDTWRSPRPGRSSSI
jgi:hypothetical protein